MKKLLILIFLFGGLFSFAQTRYISCKVVNLRSQPNTTASVLSKLSQNTEVEIVEETNDSWSKVSVNGTEGYVSTSCLSEEPQATVKSQKQNEATVMICNSKSAYAYHSRRCRGLARCSHGISNVSVSEAKSMGYSPCKICY